MKQKTTSILGITSKNNPSKCGLSKQLTLTLLAALLVVFTFSSCNSYPEGPLISLTSKTERVTNSWKIVQALEDGVDVTSDYNKYELIATNNGEARLTANYTFLGAKFDFETEGTWSFVNDFKEIAFNYDNDSADVVYQILKLTEDEMWLKENGTTLELHYVTQ